MNTTIKNSYHELLIPDNWAGSVSCDTTLMNNLHHESVNFLENWHSLKGISFHKLLLVGGNNYAMNGVRNILAELGNIQLKTHNDNKNLQSVSDIFSPDSIFLEFNSLNELSENIENIFKIRRKIKPKNIIILCDDIPNSLIGNGEVIKNITLISGKMPINDIENLIKNAMHRKEKVSTSNRKTLSIRQVQILEAYGFGASTKKIASKFKINCKTVLTHKYQAHKRLGLNNRTQMAIVAQAVAQFYKYFPHRF